MNILKTYSAKPGFKLVLNNFDGDDLPVVHDSIIHEENEALLPLPEDGNKPKLNEEENEVLSPPTLTKSPGVSSCLLPVGKSRYGRAHKPKITEDFLPTDKKVGAILGLSPKGKSSLNVSTLDGCSINETRLKGRTLFENVEYDDPALNSNIHGHFIQRRKRKKKFLHSSKKKETEQVNIVNCKLPPSFEIKSPRENIISELTTSTPVNNDLANEKSLEFNWTVGDMAWARVGRFPFWPCLITNDPHQDIFKKTSFDHKRLSSQEFVHVQFYGDHGRRCWCPVKNVLAFEGETSFASKAENILSQMQKKDKKVNARELVKTKWQNAVQEAEEYVSKSREERVEFFLVNYPVVMKVVKKKVLQEKSKLQSLSKKRKLSAFDESYIKPSKKMRLAMGGTPSLLSSGHKKVTSKDAAQGKRKMSKKKRIRNKKLGKDFELFSEKHFSRVSEEHPNKSKKEIEKFLLEMWTVLDDTEKLKYQSKLPLTPRDSSESCSSEEEEDVAEGDTRYSLTPAFLKKGGGLFRGAAREKVCQVCLKQGHTMKCKGPCLGVFHLDCVKHGNIKEEIVIEIVKKRRKKNRHSSKDSMGSNAEKYDGNIDETVVDEIVTDVKKDAVVEELEEHCSAEVSVSEKMSPDADCDVMNEADKNPVLLCEGNINDEDRSGIDAKSDEKEEQLELKVKEEETEEQQLEPKEKEEEFKCNDCAIGQSPPCFVCEMEVEVRTKSDIRQRCVISQCGKFYHSECLKAWPQVISGGGGPSRRQAAALNKGVTKDQIFTCPQHVCHTCASDDPRNVTMRLQHERLVRCVRCPTAYHSGNYCLPAGSEILSGSQIVCPRHYIPPPRGIYHVNAAWCSLCTKGGSLICCDLCPNSFHLDCLRIPQPEGGYICEDCDTGRFPLYGEVVWVKLGVYRWWPALILFPNQIPENIKNLPHRRGEFAIRFFGSHDHYWVNRGRVFFYQEGDSGLTYTKKSSVDETFHRALQEALEAHKTMKVEKAVRETETRQGMKPPAYVRIKSNKPVGNVRLMEANPASMTPCDCNPASENPCGPDTDCINRILLVECSPGVCAAGDRCRNQCFEKRQYPPLVPFKTEDRGWGLKTLANIQKGDFVIEYVGELIDEAEYRQRLERKHQKKDENYYFLTIDKDRMLDAGPKGNNARFMNHSCQPNCETQKWTVNGDTRVGLFALCDIPEGSELTFNYNLECVGSGRKPCNCGAPNCSGFIGVKASKQTDVADEKDKKPQMDLESLMKSKRGRSRKSDAANLCYKCGESGKLIFCDNKTCPKGYHLSCVRLKKTPKGKWLCPWHRCNICCKRTVRRCSFCPNSFCIQHADGNIRTHSVLGLVCQLHDRVESENLIVESGKTSKVSRQKLSSGKRKSVSMKEMLKGKHELNYDTEVNDLALDENEAVKKPDEQTRDLVDSDVSAVFVSESLVSSVIEPVISVTKGGRPRKNPGKPEHRKRHKNDDKTPLDVELEDVALSFVGNAVMKSSEGEMHHPKAVNGYISRQGSKRRQPSKKVKDYFEVKPIINLVPIIKVEEEPTAESNDRMMLLSCYDDDDDERSPKSRKTILKRVDHKIPSEMGYKDIEEIIIGSNVVAESNESVAFTDLQASLNPEKHESELGKTATEHTSAMDPVSSNNPVENICEEVETGGTPLASDDATLQQDYSIDTHNALVLPVGS